MIQINADHTLPETNSSHLKTGLLPPKGWPSSSKPRVSGAFAVCFRKGQWCVTRGGDFSGLQSMTSKWPEVFAVWERYRLCGLVIMNPASWGRSPQEITLIPHSHFESSQKFHRFITPDMEVIFFFNFSIF